jgi:GT2 family glycosyltransferase
LRSLATIGHLDPDVLVFDDGSTAPVNKIVSGTGVAARVIRDDSSPGYIVGRNRLVKEARGEFVLLLDDDTRLLTAGSVEAAIGVLRGDPEVAAVGFAQAEADGRPWPARMQPSSAREPAIIPSFIGFAHLLRRSTFLQLSGYRESFQFYGEEKDFCLRLMDAGYKTVYLPDALVAHVIDPASRDLRRYLRLVARNDCLGTLYNDPMTRLVWMLPARFALYFRMRRGWRIRDPWGGLWLARDVVGRIPAVWKQRRPVSRGTLARWRELRTHQTLYQAPSSQAGGAGGR